MAYNGHKNWSHWSVSLWIANDEGLYNLAHEAMRRRTKNAAAAYFIETLKASGITKTPDGADYSKSAVRAALAGI